jgi:hypothetical protein
MRLSGLCFADFLLQQTPGLIHTPIGGFSTEFLREFPLSLVPFKLINISKRTEMRKTKREERQVASCLCCLPAKH